MVAGNADRKWQGSPVQWVEMGLSNNGIEDLQTVYAILEQGNVEFGWRRYPHRPFYETGLNNETRGRMGKMELCSYL